VTKTAAPDAGEPVPGYPVARQCPYRPPAEFAQLRGKGGLIRVRLYDGSEVWAAVGHAEARAILADPRMSSSREHAAYRLPMPFPSLSTLRKRRPHRPLIGTDPPEHDKLRRQLIPRFAIRRMTALQPGIQRVVDERLTAMAAAGPPADLVTWFALPVPSRVICELLGVPYADHEFFEEQARRRLDPVHADAMNILYDYLDRLIGAKQRDPGTGLLDELLGLQVREGILDRQELVSLALELLIAGHDTTANVLALGTMALLEHPDQLAAVRAGAAPWPQAVEEIMRYVSIVAGMPRVAMDDAEIGGKVIKAGECVIVAVGAANHDEALVERPGELDVRRSARSHLGFGHGTHQCLGQNLARIEMNVAFRTLFDRFPDLRLAVPAAQVPGKNELLAGVAELPVAW
jgi:pentalenic acid synthase